MACLGGGKKGQASSAVDNRNIKVYEATASGVGTPVVFNCSHLFTILRGQTPNSVEQAGVRPFSASLGTVGTSFRNSKIIFAQPQRRINPPFQPGRAHTNSTELE